MKIKIILILSLCILNISLNAQNANMERHWKDGTEKVRIISYNIFNGFNWGKDADRKIRFIDWVKKQDPEIIALQELCGFTQESLLQLAKQWGHPYAIILKEEGYPVGITSKHPIQLKNKLLVGYGHGLLHVKTYNFEILVTHLNPGERQKRLEEAQNIINYIKDKSLTNFMLMGDMNSHSPMDADYMEANAIDLLNKYGGDKSTNLLDGDFDYSVISTFLSYPLIDICRKYIKNEDRYTFPTPILMYMSRHSHVRKKINERIDFIFTTPSLVEFATDAFIYNGGDPDYLSDHYPIAIDLCVPTKDTINK